MNIYLDIETIPSQSPGLRADFAAQVQAPGQYKKADSIAEWLLNNRDIEADAMLAKTSLDGAFGHILCVGAAIDDGAPVVFCNTSHASNAAVGENLTLAEFNAWLQEACGPTSRPLFIGHNLVEFDLRFLFHRSIVCSVKPCVYIPFEKRPWDEGVYDTMTKWAGIKNRVSLDKIAKALGLLGKNGIDGSMVWPMVQAGKIKEVCDYCADDVVLTRNVYKRMTFQ